MTKLAQKTSTKGQHTHVRYLNKGIIAANPTSNSALHSSMFFHTCSNTGAAPVSSQQSPRIMSTMHCALAFDH
jgi:hypothetical protein